MLKPQYRWLESGHLLELQQSPDTWLSMPAKGVYFAAWNGFQERWEFGLSDGHLVNRVWDIAHLPPEFRTNLLLLGVQ